MPIDSTHIEYDESLFSWELLDDIAKGEQAVKEAGTKYLPMLGGQDTTEYTSYKQRGSFFNAFARSVQGLAGFIFRKPIKKKLPTNIEKLLPSIMVTGQSFEDLALQVATNVLKTGRVGLLVDSKEESDPYIALYKAIDIINWRVEFVDGEEQITLLVLREMVNVQGKDEYDIEQKLQYRAFHLRDDGVEVLLWQKKSEAPGKEKWMVVDTLRPSIRGKRQTKIMFTFIGADVNTATVNKPPLMDMAWVNISHWRLSVDYHHGLHFCSLPTPWAAGFNDEEQELTIGPVHVWVSSEIGARCGYLEFTGQGLVAVKSAMRGSEEQMAILGARIIEQTRSRVETAEASKIRQSGESGALTTIANNVSSGLTDVFVGMADWQGSPSTDIFVALNTDFIDMKLLPEEITALLKSYQSGAMSMETMLWNFDKGELLPPGHTPEDEMALIDAQEDKPFENEDTGGVDEDKDPDIEEETNEPKKKEGPKKTG